uniref:Zinc-ribbon domain-containing protein n=1 Tax=Dulem virus 33 TaxID=3145751 RepID=A0AAU8B8L0_9CAUD
MTTQEWCGPHRDIENADTITPESLVRHGRWETVRSFGVDNCCRCSSCRTEWYFGCGGSVDNGSKFCPNCGAKMDLEDKPC